MSTAPANASAPRPSAHLPEALPFVCPELAAYHERLAQHRAEAFTSWQPIVAGIRIRPISLLSLDRLRAFGCGLLDGSSARFEDLATFVWLHHPRFGQFARVRLRLVAWRLRWELTPAFPRLGAFLVFAAKLPRFRWLRPLAWLVTRGGRPCTSEARLAAAIAQVRELLVHARMDWPAGDDDGPPLPFAFPAYVVNLVKGRHPTLTRDEILQWPLVELVQWLRAIIHEKDPRALLMDRTEAAIIAAALGEEEKK